MIYFEDFTYIVRRVESLHLNRPTKLTEAAPSGLCSCFSCSSDTSYVSANKSGAFQSIWRSSISRLGIQWVTLLEGNCSRLGGSCVGIILDFIPFKSFFDIQINILGITSPKNLLLLTAWISFTLHVFMKKP